MPENNNDKSRDLLSPAEVAGRLGVSPVTVRSWVQKGWLKSYPTPGGHRRFLWEDVEQLLATKDRARQQGESLKVLIVDDEDPFRGYLVDSLNTIAPEVQVREAIDGFQAGVAMAEFIPDLVLLDYSMPGINGATVCQFIRQTPAYANTQVIAITGLATPQVESEMLAAGADRVLFKPVEIEKIREILLGQSASA